MILQLVKLLDSVHCEWVLKLHKDKSSSCSLDYLAIEGRGAMQNCPLQRKCSFNKHFFIKSSVNKHSFNKCFFNKCSVNNRAYVPYELALLRHFAKRDIVTNSSLIASWRFFIICASLADVWHSFSPSFSAPCRQSWAATYTALVKKPVPTTPNWWVILCWPSKRHHNYVKRWKKEVAVSLTTNILNTLISLLQLPSSI